MNILTTILLVMLCILALILIFALFMKKNHYAKSDIIINAPRQRIFDYVKLIKNQETFNKNAMADPDRINEFKGIDGTVGFIYSWSGNKNAGEGQKEIMKIDEGKRIEMEIRFVKPMKAIGHLIMETESISVNQTKVSWSNSGFLNYPLNIMIPIMEKHVAKDMNSSLSTLKTIIENQSSHEK